VNAAVAAIKTEAQHPSSSWTPGQGAARIDHDLQLCQRLVVEVFARIDHKFDLTCTLINKRTFVHWYVGEDLATLEDYQARSGRRRAKRAPM
jgi:hypothetical protein